MIGALRRLAAAARPRPFEVWTVGGAALTILFLRWRGLDYGWNTVAHTFPSLLSALPRLLLLGVGLRALALLLVREPVGAYLRGLVSARWATTWLRLWVMVAVQIYAYMWLKVSIPLVHARLWDVELWRLDRWLHAGLSPTVFAIELVAGTPLAPIVDRLYALWIPSVPLVFACVFAARDDGRRRNFAFASAVLWTLGAWIYLAVPALGPCYSSPDVLAPLADAMPEARATQQALWQHYLHMVRSRGSVPSSFSPMLGVAAMPSLHVGAYVLFALWARRHAPRWQVPWIVASVVVFFGSLATGWHYAVDGYAGAALAWLAVRAADRFEPVAPPAAPGDPAAGTSPASPPPSPPAVPNPAPTEC